MNDILREAGSRPTITSVPWFEAESLPETLAAVHLVGPRVTPAEAEAYTRVGGPTWRGSTSP